MSAIESTVSAVGLAFRPEPDAIPTSIESAVSILRQRRAASWDVSTTMNRVHMRDDGKMGIPGAPGQIGFDGSHVWASAARQLAQWHGIPWPYVEKMERAGHVDLIARNMNQWGSSSEKPVLVRGMGDSVRGFLSDSYKVVWDLAALEVAIQEALRLTGGSGLEWKNGVIGERKTTLRLLLPSIVGEPRVGDLVRAGIEFGSSETGHGAVSISSYADRLSCLNGAVWKATEATRIIHLGRSDDEHSMDRVRAGVRAAVSSFNNYLVAAKAASGQAVGNPVDALKHVARTYEFDDSTMDRLLLAFGAEPESTQYGVVQAVTRAAQGEDRFEDRFVMERAGGELMMLEPATFVRQYDRTFTDQRN